MARGLIVATASERIHEQEEKARPVGLLALWPFVCRIARGSALLALVLTALVIGDWPGWRMIIDQGFVQQSMEQLNRAVAFTIGLI